MDDLDWMKIIAFIVIVIGLIGTPFIMYGVCRAALAIIHILEGIAHTYS